MRAPTATLARRGVAASLGCSTHSPSPDLQEGEFESETATDAEVRAVEVAMIRELRSNDPAVGYNRWPRHRP